MIHEPAPDAAQNPMLELQHRLMCIERNIETLRTRVTQVGRSS